MNRGRRSKPNRGGGRFNKPRPPSEQHGLQDQSGEQKNEWKRKQADQPHEKSNIEMDKSHRKPKSQAPIQRLHMSAENQEMLQEMLQELHGSSEIDEADSGSDFHFDLRQLARNEAYWKRMGDPRLLVIEEDASSGQRAEGDDNLDGDGYNPYAVKKLLQCGFERKRCLDALQRCDGDVGMALEELLCGCSGQSSLGKSNPDYSAKKFEDAKLQRAEELVALQSIYEDTFTEAIPDTVWVIKFDLPYLKDEFKPKVVKEKLRKKKPVKIPANMCKFFVRGYCRFGDKCRMVHNIKESDIDENQVPDLTEGSTEDFQLEVRFPEGSLYPFEPPLVAFYCTNTTVNVPPAGCLNMTLRLIEEAKMLCESESPAVFSLINLLETKDEVVESFRMPPSGFSLPGNSEKPANSVTQTGDSELADDEENDDNVRSNTEESGNSTLKQEVRKKDTNMNIGRKLKQQFQRIQVRKTDGLNRTCPVDK